MNQEELKEVKIKQLALDILQEKVFTSRHISSDSDEEWLDTMTRVFNATQLGNQCRALIEQKEFSRSLFYEYLHLNINPNPNDLPIFKSVEIISGHDLEKLEKELAFHRGGLQ